ncbi:hypothetical protein FXO37_04394 [Capsicum annuum]|nr:hypothetical protein FXO37_04394 [Capsicum annuum]
MRRRGKGGGRGHRRPQNQPIATFGSSMSTLVSGEASKLQSDGKAKSAMHTSAGANPRILGDQRISRSEPDVEKNKPVHVSEEPKFEVPKRKPVKLVHKWSEETIGQAVVLDEEQKVVAIKRKAKIQYKEPRLVETKVKQVKVGVIMKHSDPSWMSFNNYSHAENGRIWVLWDPKFLEVILIRVEAQYLYCQLRNRLDEMECAFTFIYGYNTLEQRNNLWDNLKLIAIGTSTP